MGENGEAKEKKRYLLQVGQRVKAKREEMGLTQKEFADRYGYARTTLAKLEAGIRDFKSTEIARLADQLEVSCDYLLGRSRAAAPDDFVQTATERLGLSEDAQKALAGMTDAARQHNFTSYILHSMELLLTTKHGMKIMAMLERLLEPKASDDDKERCFAKIIYSLSLLVHSVEAIANDEELSGGDKHAKR